MLQLLPNFGLGWRRIRVGMARKFAVLGSPIEHSKSPQIHSAAYQVLGLDWSYSRFEVKAQELEPFLNAHSDFDGFSLTMPLKERALELADKSNEDANLTGVANTLLRVDDGWSAFNTDVFGIEQALGQLEISAIREIALYGSGATARSAVVACSRLFPGSTLVIHARNREAASELSAFARQLDLEARLAEVRDQTAPDLTISTLPPGVWASLATKPLPSGVLFDVAYNPWPSVAATEWQQKGFETISGIQMLIWQAIAQIRIFMSGSTEIRLDDEAGLVAVMLNASK